MEQARQRYGLRGREGRRRMLDEICALCGYGRKYDIKALGGRHPIAGCGGRCRGGSARVYGEAERAAPEPSASATRSRKLGTEPTPLFPPRRHIDFLQNVK